MAKLKNESTQAAQGKSKEKAIEVSLWDAANKLRGSVEPAEYKHVVLSLIFLKFASDKFEAHREKLIAEGKEKYIEMPEFYNMSNVFFLEESSRWNYLIKKSKQNDIALLIDTALHTIEKNNKALRGALPDNYFSRLGLDVSKLSSLLDTINDIDTGKDPKNDLVGRVYEYFLSKFALAEGKGKGEFYTPKSIVNLIAEMIEPYKGIIYDPACGSGGMFVQSIKFIEAHHGNKKEVSIYGQEYTNTTYKLAKMNLAIRGITANLGDKAADTFLDDQHKDLKADFIMANPPFNQKDWRAENELLDDPRWRGYDVPPKSNANYAWILNMVSKLSENGIAGFILANGALSGGGDEYKIRRKLIENDLVEAVLILPRNMFYTTDISVTLWIINKNKKARVRENGHSLRHYRNREKEILFMDLRQMGIPFEKKYTQFSDADIAKITGSYHNWQSEPNSKKESDSPQQAAPLPKSELESNSRKANKKESALDSTGELESNSREANKKESALDSTGELEFNSREANKKESALDSTGELQFAPTRFAQSDSAQSNSKSAKSDSKSASLSKGESRFAPTEFAPYRNIPEFSYSASFEEIKKKDFSLVPSKYIEFINRDENIDFDEKMTALQSEFAELLKAEEQSKKDLLSVFKELGYEIEL